MAKAKKLVCLPAMWRDLFEMGWQVKFRAGRLGTKSSEQFDLVSTTNADDVVTTIASGKYQLVFVDNIQTIVTER